MDELFERLSRSPFRSGFRLNPKDAAYLEAKGVEVVRSHAEDFVATRLAPARPRKDGKQTPMRGHPAFVAQHATGTCCRSCLSKWHGIPAGRALSPEEQERIVNVIMDWIGRRAG